MLIIWLAPINSYLYLICLAMFCQMSEGTVTAGDESPGGGHFSSDKNGENS